MTNVWEPLTMSKVTVLAGAGVGVPAGAPTARDLVADIAEALVTDRACAKEVTSRVQPHGKLRFESAMDWLTEAADPYLDCLGFLDDLKPGPLHRSIAAAAIGGATVLTTNFDDLFEQAIDAAGERPATLDIHEPRARRPRATDIAVVKLHGTRRLHRSGHPLPSPRPLHATISEIVRAGSGFGFTDDVQRRLARMIDGRTLLVAGYSGSDDLDVMPSLARSHPKRVVWLHFAPTAPAPLSDPSVLGGGTAQLLSMWATAGTNVEVVVGDTSRALRRMGWHVGPARSRRALAAATQRRRGALAMWARAARADDPTGLAWVSLVLGELGLYEEAYAAAHASLPSVRVDGSWTEQRRLYELAQTRYLSADADLDEVLHLALGAADLAAAQRDYDLAARSEIMRARALQLRDDLDGAEAALQSAAVYLRRDCRGARQGAHTKLLLTLWWGYLHRRRGDARRASRAASIAASRARSLGVWAQECEALRLLAQARFIDGKLSAAMGPLERAISIARIGPYHDELHYALALKAMLLVELGHAAKAIGAAREAVALGRSLRLGSEINEALRTLGVCASELGLLGEAREAFASGLRHVTENDGQFFIDTVVGLAESFVLSGERHAARRLLDEYPRLARDLPWANARVSAIRWRADAASARTADRALAKALGDRDPYAHEALSLLRMGRTGRAYDTLVALVLDLLHGPGHGARRALFLAAMPPPADADRVRPRSSDCAERAASLPSNDAMP